MTNLDEKPGKKHRHPHILNAATNLLGICFVIIGGLKITNSISICHADELAWLAAGLLLTSAILAYLVIRNDEEKWWQSEIADWSFMAGMITVSISVVVAAMWT
jgi:hypothetical protein